VASNARLEAQGFDGVIQFVASGAHYPHPDTMTQLSKGSMLRWGNIIDDDSVRFALMPDRKQYLTMPGGARQYGDVLEMAKSGHVAKANITDTVAGIPCEVWRYEGKLDDGRPDAHRQRRRDVRRSECSTDGRPRLDVSSAPEVQGARPSESEERTEELTAQPPALV
jgi:hypothetical protein